MTSREAYQQRQKAKDVLCNLLCTALRDEHFVRLVADGELDFYAIEGLEGAILKYAVAVNVIEESHYEAAWNLILDKTGTTLQRLEDSVDHKSDIDELVDAIERMTEVIVTLRNPQPELKALVEIMGACSPWEPEVYDHIAQKITPIITRRNKAAMRRIGPTIKRLKKVSERLKKVRDEEEKDS